MKKVSKPSSNFILWRQDDNGVTAEVGRFHSREAAEQACRNYAEKGHKQHYWIEPAQRMTPPAERE